MTPFRVDPLLNRLRMRQVALLLAVDAFGTLHAAARQLGMTQPAASKMLHELEETFGEPLFDRIGRGLRLNDAGQAVLTTFRGIRSGIASLQRELLQLGLGSSGKLQIGSIDVATPTYLSTAILALKEKYPALSIELLVGTSDRLVALLRDGQLDVVIGRLPQTAGDAPQDCVFVPIGEEAVSVIAACDHPLAQRRGKKRLDFHALLDYPWIFQMRGSPLRDFVEQEFRSYHVALPPGLVETSSFLTMTDLVARSRMIAIVPESIAGRFARHHLVSILPYRFRNTLSCWGSLVYRDRHINPVLRTFLDLMHATAQA